MTWLQFFKKNLQCTQLFKNLNCPFTKDIAEIRKIVEVIAAIVEWGGLTPPLNCRTLSCLGPGYPVLRKTKKKKKL